MIKERLWGGKALPWQLHAVIHTTTKVSMELTLCQLEGSISRKHALIVLYYCEKNTLSKFLCKNKYFNHTHGKKYFFNEPPG